VSKTEIRIREVSILKEIINVNYIKVSTAAADKVWDWCRTELGWNCKLSTSAAWGRTLKELKG